MQIKELTFLDRICNIDFTFRLNLYTHSPCDPFISIKPSSLLSFEEKNVFLEKLFSILRSYGFRVPISSHISGAFSFRASYDALSFRVNISEGGTITIQPYCHLSDGCLSRIYSEVHKKLEDFSFG